VWPWGVREELWEVSTHCRHLHNLHILHTGSQNPLLPTHAHHNIAHFSSANYNATTLHTLNAV
jgi:hypothetical protein